MKLKHLLAGTAAALALAPLAAMADGHMTRGSSGHLNIIYWQAPSTLNPYLSGGTKEVESASLVLESMARFDESGTMVPWLAADIPTVENGGIAEDLTSITWTIAEGVTWSDGTALTPADLIFTWEYCTHPEGGCAQASYFDGVTSVEAIDDSTVRVNFETPHRSPTQPLSAPRARSFRPHNSPIVLARVPLNAPRPISARSALVLSLSPSSVQMT